MWTICHNETITTAKSYVERRHSGQILIISLPKLSDKLQDHQKHDYKTPSKNIQLVRVRKLEVVKLEQIGYIKPRRTQKNTQKRENSINSKQKTLWFAEWFAESSNIGSKAEYR